MEIASCTGSFLGPPSSSCLGPSWVLRSRSPSSVRAIFSCPPCASFPPHPPGSSLSSLPNSPLSFSPLQLHPSFNGSLSCCAIEGKSSASTSDVPATEGLDTSKTDLEPLNASSDGSAEAEKDESQSRKQEDRQKALSQIRKEGVAAGQEGPSKTEEFWRGVLEETRLIEWPPFQKVFGTTGVVVGIIVGSSLVLLTVNAVLAQLSDTIFHNAPPV